MVYRVITDLKSIAKLQRQLGKKLRQTFHWAEERTITYPSGNNTGKVYFADKKGSNVSAWSSGLDKNILYNLILFGEPGSASWLEIAGQLNFPAKKFTRAVGGVFLEDEKGHIYIAHRGKLTRGHGGLKKQEVLNEFFERLVDAEDIYGWPVQLILIAELSDSSLSQKLCDFAKASRSVAERLANGKKTANTGTSKKKLIKLLLRDYFDEYAGLSKANGRKASIRESEHGNIVKKLEAEVRSRGVTQKAQAIDLALVQKDVVHLYEVKTSARTTDVYTAVGQLLIHGHCINDLLGLPVKHYLVLPTAPLPQHAHQITAKGRMEIVLYRKTENGYFFDGL